MKRSRTIEVVTLVEIEVVARCTVESDGEVTVEDVKPSGGPRGKQAPDLADWLDSTAIQAMESEAATQAAAEDDEDLADRYDAVELQEREAERYEREVENARWEIP